jgi:hypothetical protein
MVVFLFNLTFSFERWLTWSVYDDDTSLLACLLTSGSVCLAFLRHS